MQQIIARLTEEAEKDLEGISNYTLERWGHQQLEQYVGGLGETLNSISTGKIEKVPYSDQYSSTLLYMKRYESYFIFYIDNQEDPDDGPIIVAILNSKMDIPTHLKQRMSD